jgi:hypothetical protein
MDLEGRYEGQCRDLGATVMILRGFIIIKNFLHLLLHFRTYEIFLLGFSIISLFPLGTFK